MISASVLMGVCMLTTACAGSAAASVQNGALLSAMPASGTGTTEGSSTVEISSEIPGGVDYSVYEAYGLAYDEGSGCYTYKGSVVRFFHDPAAGASFTNFFTGTVDIEAKRDADNNLIGIEECSQEVYDRHTQKHKSFQGMPIGTESDAATEAGTGQGNVEWLKEYEDYGVSYHSQDGRWHYGDEEIRLLIDRERASVYFTDKKGVCLVVIRDGDHNITEIEIVPERDAGLLLEANKPDAAGGFTVEEN